MYVYTHTHKTAVQSLSRGRINILPTIKTEAPTTIALPIPPNSSANIAAKHPNPPPNMVPIARFMPLLSVAPDIRASNQSEYIS